MPRRLALARLARAAPPPPVPPEGLPFPPGFLWGSGEDAYQHEGGNDRADWWAWERSEPRPFRDGSTSGRCADFWNRWEEDLGRAAADGHNSHRIGLEWSRLEPEPGRWDEEAWERYRAMLLKMRELGLTSFVNLWHFTLPAWASDPAGPVGSGGGFLDPSVLDRFEAFTAEAARRLGPLVDYWSTMIDAQIYALRGYLLGEIPPLRRAPDQAARVFEALALAHARARTAIKAAAASRGAEAKVGQIWFYARFEPAGSPLDAFAASQLDRVFNTALPDALVSGRLELSVLGLPRLRADIPGLRNGLDWLGVNYYFREIVRFDPGAPGMLRREPGPLPARSDMGWEIHPEGLRLLLRRLAARYPKLPLVVTENGLADAEDSRRPAFIAEHLAWLHRALAEGVPVLGYHHWAMTDNLEWLEGFGPKFGLYEVDRATMERRPRPSARFFARIARENRLPPGPPRA